MHFHSLDNNDTSTDETELSYPTEKELLSLRTVPFDKADDKAKQLWYWYAGEALATIPSNWKKNKSTMANTALHEAVTISDEAFVITVIVIYKDKFEKAAKSPRKPRAGRRKGETQWSNDMIWQFSKCYEQVKALRENDNASSWEVAFQEYYKGLKSMPQMEENGELEEEEEGGSETDLSIPMDDLE